MIHLDHLGAGVKLRVWSLKELPSYLMEFPYEASTKMAASLHFYSAGILSVGIPSEIDGD